MTLALALLAAGLGATERLAVVVGDNAGEERRSLRFAEDDAGKVARALAEVGQVRPDDIFLLQGKGARDVGRAFDLARARVERWHATPSTRVLLYFYFSGHSDGEALELGHDRLTYLELRGLLERSGAEVKVAIVDSCRSGALLAQKGAAPGGDFDIRLTDDLSSTGQVLSHSPPARPTSRPPSSAALGGSIFTHHFLSSAARRGRYVRGTGASPWPRPTSTRTRTRWRPPRRRALARSTRPTTTACPGQGELVLAELTGAASAWLELPAGFSRALVQDLRRDQVLAEVPGDGGRRLSVAPGDYAVRLDRGGRVFEGHVRVAEGERRAVAWDELAAVGPAVGLAKGPDATVQAAAPVVVPAPTVSVALSAGALSGVGAGLGPLFGGQADVGLGDGAGASPRDRWGRRQRSSGVLRDGGACAGRLPLRARTWGSAGPLALFAGPELGGGTVWQFDGRRERLRRGGSRDRGAAPGRLARGPAAQRPAGWRSPARGWQAHRRRQPRRLAGRPGRARTLSRRLALRRGDTIFGDDRNGMRQGHLRLETLRALGRGSCGLEHRPLPPKIKDFRPWSRGSARAARHNVGSGSIRLGLVLAALGASTARAATRRPPVPAQARRAGANAERPAEVPPGYRRLLAIGSPGHSFERLPAGVEAHPPVPEAIVFGSHAGKGENLIARVTVANDGRYVQPYLDGEGRTITPIRAELSTLGAPDTAYREGDERIYRLSLALDRGWRPDARSAVDIVTQFKRTGGGPDAFLGVKGTDLVLRAGRSGPGARQDTVVRDVRPGEWVHLLMRVRWSTTPAGRVVVASRYGSESAFVPAVDFSGPNMDPRPGKTYLKFGIYKPSGFSKPEDGPRTPRIVYFTDLSIWAPDPG